MDQPRNNPNFRPENPIPNPAERAPEASQAPNQNAEQAPKVEKRSEAPLENNEPAREAILPPVQVAPPIPVDTQQPAQPQAATTDTGLTADDVDVIEMEWVKRADRIIEETKDDPHAQEKAVEALQVEYLEKRYGKKIKRSRSE